MVQHIQQQKQKSSTSASGQTSLSGSTVTHTETPFVTSEAVDNQVNNSAASDNLDHVEKLTRAMSETALNDTHNTGPFDYIGSEEEEDLGPISETEAHRMLYDDLPNVTVEDMDSLAPTVTAAIPQGSTTIFYGDPNYIDLPVNVPGLPPALPATLLSEALPSLETSSQAPDDSIQDEQN